MFLQKNILLLLLLLLLFVIWASGGCHSHPIPANKRGEAALRTKGSGGPSGVDANGFKRMLACKSFKKSSTNLCDSLATLARRLCTEFVDPLTIEPILASRLIPLDKGNGDS